MDLDALMSSMKAEMYGGHAESSDEADPLQIGEEQELSTETIEAAKGIWNPHVTAASDVLKRAVRTLNLPRMWLLRASNGATFWQTLTVLSFLWEVSGRSPVESQSHPGTEAARWKAVRSLQSRFERLCAKHLGEHWNPAFER